MSGPVIGIDMGTCYSRVACVRNGVAELIPNAEGDFEHASMVSFVGNDGYLVGNRALPYKLSHPRWTFDQLLRLLGRFSDSHFVQNRGNTTDYGLTHGSSDEVLIQLGEQTFPVSELSGIILGYMRTLAELHLNEQVQRAAISVPVGFDVNQRHAVREAARLAGFDEVRLISAPLATALALFHDEEPTERVGVFHYGGGSVDLSVVTVNRDVFRLDSAASDFLLGGHDLDTQIVDTIFDELAAQHSLQMHKSVKARAKTRHLVDRAKQRLTSTSDDEAHIGKVGQQEQLVELKLTRERLESVVNGMMVRGLMVCDEALTEANLSVDHLDRVIVTGGAARPQFVQEKLASFFSPAPLDDQSANPLEAIGAAFHAHHLWIERAGMPVVIESLPLALRLGTAGGYTVPIMERNTPLPFRQRRTFTTRSSEKQRSISLKVFQGEERRQKDNQLIGEFHFHDFPQTDDERFDVEAMFSLSVDGLLTIEAADPYSGESAAADHRVSPRLSDDEIQRILDEHPVVTLADGSGVR